jgi:hypothetical protein
MSEDYTSKSPAKKTEETVKKSAETTKKSEETKNSEAKEKKKSEAKEKKKSATSIVIEESSMSKRNSLRHMLSSLKKKGSPSPRSTAKRTKVTPEKKNVTLR